MRNLLHDADRDRLLGLLTGKLARQVTLGGARHQALAEGEAPEDEALCSAAANARAAELLALPFARAAAPALAEAVLDFALAMERAPAPLAAGAETGLEIRRDDPRDFEILTRFHRFTGDLGAGMVRQELRGSAWRQAGAPRQPVLHSGNLMQFRIGRHRATVDVEDNTDQFSLERQGAAVVLTHSAPARGKAGLFFPREVAAGRVTYRYEIAADSPWLRLTVAFHASHALKRLRLTTALDALDESGLEFAAGRLRLDDGWTDVAPLPEPGLAVWSAGAKLPQLSLGQAGWPAAGPTVHLRPADPARVLDTKLVSTRRALAHWLVLRHGPFDLAAGAEATVGEARLLAQGLPPEAVADGHGAGIARAEPAVLGAVGATLLLARDLPAERRGTLLAWLRPRLAELPGAPAETLALAHGLLAAEAMHRIGEGDAATLSLLVGRLLARQTPEGAFRAAEDAAPLLAPHALATRALARAAGLVEAPRLPGAVAAALEAMRPGQVPALVDGREERQEGIALRGAAPVNPDDHAESVSLVARAVGAALLAAESGALPLPPAARDQAEELRLAAIALLRPLVSPRGAHLAVAATPLGGPATTIAQAAVTLALLGVDSEPPFPARPFPPPRLAGGSRPKASDAGVAAASPPPTQAG